MTSLWTLFTDLLERYFQYGLPFALLHLFVLIFSGFAFIDLVLETRRLERWQPESSGNESSATKILDGFIEQSRALGGQGILVSITDFSDRLDSIAEGKITALYERINLFLIVGIAGTLFGVFELAQKFEKSASEEIQLGVSLSSSLAKAFPVGFVGLVLMFFGQAVASVYENRFKKAIAEAARRALERRSGDVLSQAQIIDNAAERIERALEPLEQLQETMAVHLKPVVTELGNQLDQSLHLVKDQFDALQETTDRFAAAGQDLGKNVETLGANVQSLDSFLRGAPKVFEGLHAVQRQQEGVLKAFQDDLAKSLDASDLAIRALSVATGAAEKLPEQILAETKKALENVSLSVSGASNGMVVELKKSLTAEYNHLFQRIDETIKYLRESLGDTSSQLASDLRANTERLFALAHNQLETLEGVIQKAGQRLQTSLDASQDTVAALDDMRGKALKLPGEILEASRGAFGGVANAATLTLQAMAQDLSDRLGNQAALLQDKMNSQVQIFRENLDQASRELQGRLSFMSEEMSSGFKEQMGAVQKLVDSTADQIDKSEDYLQRSLKASDNTIAALERMSEQAARLPGQILEALGKALETVSQEASQTSRQMAADLEESLTQSSERLLKDVNLQSQSLREHLDTAGREYLGRLSADSSQLFDGVKEQVAAVQALVSHTTRQLQEINQAAAAAVEGLRGLHEAAKGSLVSSFAEMSEKSGKVWGEKSDELRREAQHELTGFLLSIREVTSGIQASLDASAKAWADAGINAKMMIEEPIARVLRDVGEELQKKVQHLDNLLMADRYPQVIKEVGEFTQRLQGLLAQAEAIQKGLDRWTLSVERSREEMEAAGKSFQENLNQGLPPAPSSAELADIVEARLEQKLEPVRAALEELGKRRRLREVPGKTLAWLKARFQKGSP